MNRKKILKLITYSLFYQKEIVIVSTKNLFLTNKSAIPLRSPTTSFLTATNLIYPIGTGITAAAGTRLALRLFLVKGFELYSFQL